MECIIEHNTPFPPAKDQQMHPFERLLRDCYDAFNARDLPGTMKGIGPHVEWPNLLDGVTMHGRDAVAAYFLRQWEQMNPHFDLRHFEMDEEGKVVLTVIQTVRGRGENLISQGLVRHLYEFEDGLVRRMDILI